MQRHGRGIKMRYSDDLVERIRTSNDIVDVIGSYVRLTKKGANYFGLCPFHSEKTGSFSVSREKQMYYCFGCHAGGSVITFIMEYENFSYPEALKLLGERVGIELPEGNESEEEKRAASLRAKILEANKAAAVYYYKKLYSEGGKTGLSYFRKRMLSDETIKSFGLGFSGKGGSEVVRYLKSKGFDDRIINEAGLSGFSEKYGMTDRFWNRVMFPIMDINNHVIGFGGRVMGDGEPKYLNSPETRVFDKSRNMYGLNVARRSKKPYRIICEGYMDVISMHQAGFTEAVASLGTAFTSGHASLISRYAKDVRLSYDSDGAGTKAALRAISICRAAGLTPRIIDLKPYKDPDEFIKNLGTEEFAERIEKAENAFFFELRMLEKEFDLNDPAGRTRFQEAMAAKLTAFEDELERNNYIASAAAKYAVDEQALKKAVAVEGAKQEGIRIRSFRGSPDIPGALKASAGEGRGDPPGEEGILRAERYLLTWISDEPEVYQAVKPYLEAGDFTAGVTEKTARLLFAQMEEGKCSPAAIVDSFEEEEEHRKVAEIFNTKLEAVESTEEKNLALTDLVVKIKEESLKRKSADQTGEGALARRISIRNTMDELKKLQIRL